MVWWCMILQKIEGVLGLRDPCLIVRVCSIKCLIRLWTKEKLFFVQWMRRLTFRGENWKTSSGGTTTLLYGVASYDTKSSIATYMSCDDNYALPWILLDFCPSLANIYNFYRPNAPADPFVHGNLRKCPSCFGACDGTSCIVLITYIVGVYQFQIVVFFVDWRMNWPRISSSITTNSKKVWTKFMDRTLDATTYFHIRDLIEGVEKFQCCS